MICWGWFDDNIMADWQFIVGERTIRLKKNPVPGCCFKDERQKWPKLARFKRWQAALSWPAAMPAWHESSSIVSSASSVHSCSWQQSPSAWWSSRLLPSCVCIHGANLRPCLGHVWLILCDTPDSSEELRGFSLYFFERSLINELSFILTHESHPNWQHGLYFFFINTEKKQMQKIHFKYAVFEVMYI